MDEMVFYISHKTKENKTEQNRGEQSILKVLERTGREERKSSMAAAASSSASIDGLSRRRVSNKRRRDEEGEGDTDEEDYKVEVNEVEENLLLSQMSSAAARRRNHTVVKVLKKDQPVKVVHEMIGVQVPRKARSASRKRSYDNQSLQKQSLEARKKRKPIVIKNWPPKSSKPASGSVEEDIENEVAEVLFGLMKQSQSSKDSDSVKSSTSNTEGKDRYSSRGDSKTSISEQENIHASDPERENVSKEISFIAEEVEVEGDKQPKMETSFPNSEAKSEGELVSSELQEEDTDPLVEDLVGGEVLKHESKRENKFEFDLMAPPPEDWVSDKFEEEALFEKIQDKKTEAIKEKLNENSDQDSGTKSQQKSKTVFSKVERNDWRSGLTATTLQPRNSSPSQPSSKRCATHLYIARNIYVHQKVTKMNNILPAASSAPICDTKPEVVSRNPTQGSFLSHKGKQLEDKASVNANFIETSDSKKVKVLRSPSQPASAANLMNELTFKIPPAKNLSSVSATNNSSGVLRYTNSTKNASQFGHSALPMVAAANLNTSNVTFQEDPSVAINGYSFPISTPSGTTLTFEGGSSAQAVPLYTGPVYSSQMSHSSQLYQQQTHLQFPHQVQSSHQKNTGVSTNSSSSQRQLESQQQRRTQSTSMHLQQSQKKHVQQPLHPCKIENETNGGSTPSSSHAQHSVYGYGQNFAMSLQPMNFTMMPYVTLSGGGTGNHSEKSQQEDLKGVIGMSFASFGGNQGTGTLLNFSSMAQNPATYQSLPATQGAQQKNHQVSERKTGIGSGNPDHDGLKAPSGKSSAVVQTLVFDNNLNFTASNSQQQQFFQFQLQQQQSMQQQQPALVARSKAPKNPSVFSQALLQCNTSVQSPKNTGRSTTPQRSIATSTVNSFIQQGRPSQGQTQISFGANPKSSLAVQQGQLTNPSLLTT